MTKIKPIIQQFPWQEVVLLAAILTIGLPSLFVNWMIVDDGYYVSVEQKISSMVSSLNLIGLKNVLLEPDRFRPALRIYLWLTYLIAGNDPVIHHLLSFLISGVTVVIIYLVIRILTLSRSAGLVGGLLFTFASFNIENWYRLKTPEPKITFFIALSLLFLVINLKHLYLTGKSKNYLMLFAILPLVFAYLIRETSFAFLPFSLFLLIGIFHFKNKTRSRLVWLRTTGIFFIANFVLAVIPLVMNIILRKQGSYTSYYEMTLSKMFSSGWLYLKLIRQSLSPLVSLLGVSFLVSWLLLFRSRKVPFERFWQLAFAVSLASCFMVLMPWGIPMGRYLELVLFFLSLALGLESEALLRIKFIKPRWKFLAFLAGFVLLISANGSYMYNYVRDTIFGQKNINKVLSYLASQAPKDSLILWNLKENEGTIELAMEANLILNNLYRRPDLKIEYLNEANLKTLSSQAIVMSAIVYERDQYYPERELLTKKPLELIQIFPHQIQTVSFNLPRLRSLLRSMITGEPYLARPILEKSSFKTQWKIYEAI